MIGNLRAVRPAIDGSSPHTGGISDTWGPIEMPKVEIRECTCDRTRNHVNLENVAVMLYCVECSGFETGFVADIDKIIDILTRMRETRVYRVVEHRAGQLATVTTVRQAKAG